MKIREFKTWDIEFALRLTEEENWGYKRKDFENLLYYEKEGCFIAEKENERIGMVTTTCYTKTAWIGCLIVEKKFREGGVGKALMMHAIQYLKKKEIKSIRLEATKIAIPLYEKLGFLKEFESLRFSSICDDFDYEGVREMGEEDLEEISRLDRIYFGDERKKVLKRLFEVSDFSFKGKEGFAMVRKSGEGYRIGPWVSTKRNAENLLKACLNHAEGKIFVGIPSANKDGVKLLKKFGFQQYSKSLRMFLGEKIVDNPKGIYGIAGAEKG